MLQGNGQNPLLAASSLVALSETILELNDLTLPDEGLFDRLVASFGTLVPHSSLWIACSDMRERAVTSYLGPWAQQAIDLAPAFGRNIESHPQFMALCQGIAAPVDSISDYTTRRKWQGTGMFHEVVRPAGAIDQLSASRPLGERLTFSIIVNRDQWGFTPEERALLGLVIPHVIQAWRTRTLLKGITSASGDLDESAPGFCCRLVCDSLGNIVEATDPVARWLAAAFGGRRASHSGMLPEVLRDWLRSKLLPGPRIEGLAVSLATTRGTSVRVSLAPGSRYDLHTLAFTAELKRAECDVAKLATLGLSHRQAEVLLWVARGKTNDEIAGILGLSLFTVKAHLRAIFAILMVENRNAAGALAWQTLQR
jgi:DNA-binding CsgD family transcriptional regulator